MTEGQLVLFAMFSLLFGHVMVANTIDAGRAPMALIAAGQWQEQ